MLRAIGAVVLGAILAFLLVAAIEAVSHQVYSVPADLDLADRETFTAYVEALPVGAFAFVGAAWALGAFGGGLLAGAIARRRHLLFALLVGGLVLAASITNLVMIPHPPVFSLLALAAVVAASFAAAALAARLFPDR